MASGTFLCASQMKRKPSGVNIHLCYQLYHSFLYSSSFFLLLWVHLPCIKTTGFSRLPSTPQEQFLHRNGTLFNFAYFLYQTRYDYFGDDSIKCAGRKALQHRKAVSVDDLPSGLIAHGHPLPSFFEYVVDSVPVRASVQKR